MNTGEGRRAPWWRSLSRLDCRGVLEDKGLREIRMTSGRALGYVQPETASQIRCQLLDKDEWERLLDGPVGLRPLIAPYGSCGLFTVDGGVLLELRGSDEALEPDTTIAGRPARRDGDGLTVALTDDALRPAPRQYYPERRLLTANPVADDSETELDRAERVLEEIVPLVLDDGEELPDMDDRGYVSYVDTPLTGDFVDLPTPVQALRLCTVAARDGGSEYPDRIAGRPALTSDHDDAWVEVKLRDDAGTSLWVGSDNAVELASKLVPLLAP